LKIGAHEAGLISFGAALNVSMGYLVSLFKLPLYLDSIGTIIISVLCGGKMGIIVAISSLAVLSGTASPTLIAYSGTAVIVPLAAVLLKKFGYLKTMRDTIIGGIILGIIAATASAPVTLYLFKGVSIAGTDALTSIFRMAGLPLWKCVLISGYITDLVDKTASSVVALLILKTLPERMLKRISRKTSCVSPVHF